MSASSVQYRIRPGGPWQRLLPSVYLTTTGTATRDQLQMAALLYAGDGSVLTGWAALSKYQIRVPEAKTVDVLVPANCKRSSHAFAVVHRTRRMPTTVLADGELAFVVPARAVADMVAGMTALSDARQAIARVVQERRCSVAQIAAELQHRRGEGANLAREVLAEVADGVRSVAEADLRVLVLRSGLPKPLFNPRLYLNGQFLACPDAWWPEFGVAVEVDSRQWHLLPADWEETMLRHRKMQVAGLHVLHFTPRELRTSPQQVVADITAALEMGKPVTGIITKPALD